MSVYRRTGERERHRAVAIPYRFCAELPCACLPRRERGRGGARTHAAIRAATIWHWQSLPHFLFLPLRLRRHRRRRFHHHIHHASKAPERASERRTRTGETRRGKRGEDRAGSAQACRRLIRWPALRMKTEEKARGKRLK